MRTVTFKPHVVSRIRATESGFIKSLLEAEAKVPLERTFLSRVDPHLDAYRDVVRSEFLNATHLG